MIIFINKENKNYVQIHIANKLLCLHRIRNDFEIPNVFGLIDGTHIHVVKQCIPAAEEHLYVNRKGFHSLNVQVVSYMKFSYNN